MLRQINYFFHIFSSLNTTLPYVANELFFKEMPQPHQAKPNIIEFTQSSTALWKFKHHFAQHNANQPNHTHINYDANNLHIHNTEVDLFPIIISILINGVLVIGASAYILDDNQ